MRVLIVHNRYQYLGGEDGVVAAEGQVLRDHGDEVEFYGRDNREISTYGKLRKLALFGRTVWSRESCRELRALCRQFRPDVAHFHNTLPLISPAGYYACRAEGVPVVQTLHNYRCGCPNGLLYGPRGLCEACLGKTVAWPAVWRGCYRESRAATIAVAAMLAVHKLAGTYRRAVAVYVALSEFSRRKYIAAGLPADRIVIKPNFLTPDPGVGAGTGGFALFVGRLTPEKGIETLRRAWREIGTTLPLRVVGDGPLTRLFAEEEIPGVEYLGRQSPERVYELMGAATALVFPSEWYEGMPRTIVEAFAKGTPVVAARIGAAAEFVEPGRTGLHFQPGDVADLIRQVEWLRAHPDELTAMRAAARSEYEKLYMADRNYEMLIGIYRQARATGR